MEGKNLDTFITDGMVYNTDRRGIKLSLYGRNIQKLVDYAMSIEDKEKRNRAAYQVVKAMEILNPKIKDIDEYKKVLWNHLAFMSEYQLDIDYPYEIIPEEQILSKPEKIVVNKKRIIKRQYGRTIEGFISKAKEIENPNLQTDFIKIILVQMKRIYINWTKDVVNDEVIFEDFKKIAKNELKIPQNFKLPHTYEIKNRIKNNNSTSNNNNNSSNNNNSNNNYHFRKNKKRKV